MCSCDNVGLLSVIPSITRSRVSHDPPHIPVEKKKRFTFFGPPLFFSLSFPDNAQCYDPAAHPDVSSGRMSPDEAFDDLSSSLCHQDADGQSEVTYLYSG